ncbi:hypothetical protein Sar04_23900 [Salinispora arenicola]|uniref:Uncharacterized protein n=1 Tax=Salinispora arenicola TaxID=168697 RepID=A0ABQ4JRS5_SALAC|nr:hypothetical protein Sar04_23900 [Salinispora arenicola]
MPQARPVPGGPATTDGTPCASTGAAPTEVTPSTIAAISGTANSPRTLADRTQLPLTSATVPVQKLATYPYPQQRAENSPAARYKRTKQAQVTNDRSQNDQNGIQQSEKELGAARFIPAQMNTSRLTWSTQVFVPS